MSATHGHRPEASLRRRPAGHFRKRAATGATRSPGPHRGNGAVASKILARLLALTRRAFQIDPRS